MSFRVLFLLVMCTCIYSMSFAEVKNERETVDIYINQLPDTNSQKVALRQMAAAVEDALSVDTKNSGALHLASKKIADATACVHARYSVGISSKKTADIAKRVVGNRYSLYEKYNDALRGTTFTLPDGDGCIN